MQAGRGRPGATGYSPSAHGSLQRQQQVNRVSPFPLKNKGLAADEDDLLKPEIGCLGFVLLTAGGFCRRESDGNTAAK